MSPALGFGDRQKRIRDIAARGRAVPHGQGGTHVILAEPDDDFGELVAMFEDAGDAAEYLQLVTQQAMAIGDPVPMRQTQETRK